MTQCAMLDELRQADEDRKNAILRRDLQAWWDRLGDERAKAICRKIWPNDPAYQPSQPAQIVARVPGQCGAKTKDGRDCWRGIWADGLCYQHSYIKRNGKWDVRWPRSCGEELNKPENAT